MVKEKGSALLILIIIVVVVVAGFFAFKHKLLPNPTTYNQSSASSSADQASSYQNPFDSPSPSAYTNPFDSSQSSENPFDNLK